MRFIPTYCDACERIALVGSNEFENGLVRCGDCNAQARSLPGESYSDADLDMFDSLLAALAEAEIGQHNAAALAAQLERSPDHPGRGLQRLTRVVPALGILELLVNNRAGSLRKAEGMLAILLDALASGRRQSVTLPSVASTAPGRAIAGTG